MSKQRSNRDNLYKEKFQNLHKKFIETDLSLSDFCRKGYYDKSIVSLCLGFKKHVTEYKLTQGKSKGH